MGFEFSMETVPLMLDTFTNCDSPTPTVAARGATVNATAKHDQLSKAAPTHGFDARKK
jgi:hypothetical protein